MTNMLASKLHTPEGKAFLALVGAKNECGQGPIEIAAKAHISYQHASDILETFRRLGFLERTADRWHMHTYLSKFRPGSQSTTVPRDVVDAFLRFERDATGENFIAMTWLTEKELAGVRKLETAKLVERVSMNFLNITVRGCRPSGAGREVGHLIRTWEEVGL
jgi:DNA-binding IclR family transcriptional regulator